MDVFILPAVICNINKWIYFRLLINRYVRSKNDHLESNIKCEAQLDRGKFQLNVGTVIIIFCYCCFYLGMFLYGCLGNFEDSYDWEKNVFFHLDLFTQFSFGICAVIFLVIGILLIR